MFSLLDKGMSIPTKDSFFQRLSVWIGCAMNKAKKNVTISEGCLISPEAKINPRGGKIFIDKNSTVSCGAIVQGNVTIGENSSVQAYTIIVGYGDVEDKKGEIKIGNNVRIASNVMIIGANHRFQNTDIPIAAQGMDRKSIVIEDNVWIAGNVNIVAGVRIGYGAVIAAGAVVTKDVPEFSVVAGVPAKVIKKLNKI